MTEGEDCRRWHKKAHDTFEGLKLQGILDQNDELIIPHFKGHLGMSWVTYISPSPL